MLTAILGFLPVIGPIIQGVVNYLNKKQDISLARKQVDADVYKTEINASVSVLSLFRYDVAVMMCRDLIMFPVAVWCALGSWDTIVAYRWPELRFLVSEFPPQMATLPLAVLGFLFGVIAVDKWKNG